MPEPQTQPLTWTFQTPPGADLQEIAIILTAYGCQFDPDRDQIALGQELGGYARSGDRQSMKDALEEACALENLPRPENPPAWENLTYAQRQEILAWFSESPEWAEEGRLRNYSSDFAREYETGELNCLFFSL